VKHSGSDAVVVSRETRARLDSFGELLLRWNRTINLISRKDETVLWDRHIQDALQLLPLMPVGVSVAVDLGSGAGFPGLVLAIASGCHFHLIESDQRKAAFLREASRLVDAPTTVHAARIEAVHLAPVGLVTARALAPLVDLIGLAMPFLASGGVLLAPKGSNVEAELTAAREQWHMRVERASSTTNAAASILQITEVSRVGSPI
jgi:16S rRNA (guanine527-N7)-methyltransferase